VGVGVFVGVGVGGPLYRNAPARQRTAKANAYANAYANVDAKRYALGRAWAC